MFPLYDTVRSRTFPIINLTLIFANIAAFLYELRMDPETLKEFHLYLGINSRALLKRYFRRMDDDLLLHVPAWRVVPHYQQHVGAVHLWR
jgi:hypothetical protein